MIDHNESFQTGDTVYCIDESIVYSEHLTKRKEYVVSNVGTGSKEGKIRIKSNLGRMVWITDLCFSSTNQPEIVKINIDDKIDDPLNDLVEVTVIFSDDSRGYINVTTPDYVKDRLNPNLLYFDKHGVFVKEITKETIEILVEQLDRENELIELLLPY